MNKILPSTRAMRKIFMPIVACFALSIAPKAQAQFTPGNVVVLQAGDGVAAATSAAAQITLKEYTTGTASQSSPVYSVALPVTGLHRITMSGNGATEGLMTRSADSLHLVISGYDAAVATLAINNTATATVNRVIDTVGIFGAPGRAATTGSAFSGQSFRSAAKNSGDNYWGAGGSSGTYYMGNAGTDAAVQTSTLNTRGVLAANGNLYFSTGSAPVGVHKISGQPTALSTATILVPTTGSGTGTASPLGFAINPAETICYIADERSTVGGGVQRWDLVGSVWTNTYTFSLGSGAGNGARGVAVDWSGTNPVIYATTGETSSNRLMKITDNGASATAYMLATASLNTAFRGVALSPRSPLNCSAPVLSSVASPRTCATGGAIILNASSTVPPTYSWTGPNSFTASTKDISNLAAGNYSVTASVPGGCVATAFASIADSTLNFPATILGGSRAICQGDSALLIANSGAGYSYQYNNASGPIAGATSMTYKTPIAGAYTVKVSSGANCTATSSAINITVNALPPATITPAGPITACTEAVVHLVANRVNGYTYQWLYNTDTASSNSVLDSTINIVELSGNMRVIVTNVLTGCKSLSLPTAVNRYPNQDTTITPAAGVLNICTGQGVQLRVTATPGSTYQWRNDAVNIPNAQDTILTATTDGIYSVALTSIHGCVAVSATRTITIVPNPAATITSLTDTACQRSIITLNAPTGAGYTFRWFVFGQLMGDTSSTFPISAYMPGSNTAITGDVRVVVINAAGCADTSALKYLTFFPLPMPVITNTGGVLGTTGNYASYQWMKDGLDIAGATNATYTPATNGVYNLWVTDAHGCSDTAAIVMRITGMSIPAYGITGVNIYPNPANDYIYISAAQSLNVLLRDMQGRIVLTAAEPKMLDISGLANGIYTLSATNKEGLLIGTTRIIKSGK